MQERQHADRISETKPRLDDSNSSNVTAPQPVSRSTLQALEDKNNSSSEEDQLVFIPRNQRRQISGQPKLLSDNPSPPSVKLSEPTTYTGLGTTNPKGKSRMVKLGDDSDKDSSDNDEAIRDYIQNVQEHENSNIENISLRPLGNHLSDLEVVPEESGSNEELRDSAHGEVSEDSDSDTNLKYADIDLDVAAVVARREGLSGTEYLFKPEGSTLVEAIWLEPSDMLHNKQYLIDLFESSLGDREASEPGSNLGARTYEKQRFIGEENTPGPLRDIEYGLQVSEDGEDYDTDDLLNMVIGKPNKHGKFPSASKLADAYDNFDVMDRERFSLRGPSKRRDKKTRVSQLSSGLAAMSMDDHELELNNQLTRQIMQDRERKRLRKQEKDSLRKAITPAKPTSIDIRGSEDGIPRDQVPRRIKEFLMNGTAERLSLPPMPKGDRQQVHVLARQFFMTSKSQGNGNNRFPVLFKTKRTTLFEGNEQAIDDLLRNSGNRYSRVGQAKTRGKAGRLQVSAGNRIFNADGMIVGTGAAEIGQGNKGYEMLAKMGWTTGTGLGSNRTGILDPIQAIVKNSRTGLG
ncbi:hypothetical protein AA313_de0200879 [Arthrobotrys entomopaga]|nr:hypothetical protein AA313_de0200879 [Arthrobotrys entomopaga]